MEVIFQLCAGVCWMQQPHLVILISMIIFLKCDNLNEPLCSDPTWHSLPNSCCTASVVSIRGLICGWLNMILQKWLWFYIVFILFMRLVNSAVLWMCVGDECLATFYFICMFQQMMMIIKFSRYVCDDDDDDDDIVLQPIYYL